jgi:hypothetical protein
MTQTVIPTEDLTRTLVEGTEKGLVGWQTQGTELYSTQLGNVTVMVGRANTATEVPFSVSVFDDQSNRIAKIDDANEEFRVLVTDLYNRAAEFTRSAKGKSPAEVVVESINALKNVKS